MVDNDPVQPSPQAGYFNATALMVVVTSTLALYNSLELLLLIFTTFKRYTAFTFGRFWSLQQESCHILFAISSSVSSSASSSLEW
jgi:hypothetical protein